MTVASDGSDRSVEKLGAVYLTELREHALTLIGMGHSRMILEKFVDAEEDDITGELQREMDNVLQLETAPPWVEFYTVAEQVRSHAADRRGKRRPIVDIEFTRNRRGPRPRLRFEAKRLRETADLRRYMGEEGLAAFLDLHYGRTHGEVGMLGYIQRELNPSWASRFAKELVPPKHRLTSTGQWKQLYAGAGVPRCYGTIHIDANGEELRVLHVFLFFTAPDS